MSNNSGANWSAYHVIVYARTDNRTIDRVPHDYQVLLPPSPPTTPPTNTLPVGGCAPPSHPRGLRRVCAVPHDYQRIVPDLRGDQIAFPSDQVVAPLPPSGCLLTSQPL